MRIKLAAVGIGVALFLGYSLFVVAVARPDGTFGGGACCVNGPFRFTIKSIALNDASAPCHRDTDLGERRQSGSVH
jgi:hypothetical protein